MTTTRLQDKKKKNIAFAVDMNKLRKLNWRGSHRKSPGGGGVKHFDEVDTRSSSNDVLSLMDRAVETDADIQDDPFDLQWEDLHAEWMWRLMKRTPAFGSPGKLLELIYSRWSVSDPGQCLHCDRDALFDASIIPRAGTQCLLTEQQIRLGATLFRIVSPPTLRELVYPRGTLVLKPRKCESLGAIHQPEDHEHVAMASSFARHETRESDYMQIKAPRASVAVKEIPSFARCNRCQENDIFTATASSAVMRRQSERRLVFVPDAHREQSLEKSHPSSTITTSSSSDGFSFSIL
ncbi:hypothetical protein CEXT_42901 [Caerostris extrusa]|uniref:Uncharacterized protein n=1 Tax=Caerostris extrusa TaxID=172846 RepID=A0AAV4TT70_CAEEX|nr:hypothetical protein CEXT_42901 [Caerostris extrusa]